MVIATKPIEAKRQKTAELATTCERRGIDFQKVALERRAVEAAIRTDVILTLNEEYQSYSLLGLQGCG